MNDDGSYVQKQLALLETYDAETIRARYRELVCPTDHGEELGPTFMKRRIAYVIQEGATGVRLTECELSALSFLATKDWRCNPKQKRPLATDKKPTRGSQFVKEYKGKTYTMEIDSLGRCVYEGTTYRSPTAVARLITGTHCNGKVWWGIN